MEEMPQVEKSNNRTMIYIIIAVVVICGCVALVIGIAAAIFGAGLFATTTSETFEDVVSEFEEEVPPVEVDPFDDGSDTTDDQNDSGNSGSFGSSGSSGSSGELVVEEIPDQGVNHVQIGAPHEQYNSDPPSSGPHYPNWVDPGFYDEVVPDEFLVHNLEHGYVIVWYDCSALSNSECNDLMANIEGLIDDLNAEKIIGMPREGMPTTIALTSWGHLARLDAFDYNLILEYYATYLNQSPEPGAP